MRSSACDTHFRHCVRSVLCWLAFPLAPALGSTGSAVAETTLFVGFSATMAESYLEEWGEILLGLALVVAPWTVGYESVSAAVSSTVSGILVILFGAWELMTDRDFTTWWHDRWHHPAS